MVKLIVNALTVSGASSAKVVFESYKLNSKHDEFLISIMLEI